MYALKMNKITSYFLVLVFFYVTNDTYLGAQELKPFALVELYTSQGCSSCPRADQYLSEIIEEAEINNQNIIALSFHVDYWNRLGWKDPYSSAFNTQRQYTYAKAMKSSNVYTPQMVINGKVEFVGGDRHLGSREIQKALGQQPAKTINLKLISSIANKIVVDYEITGDNFNEDILYIAIAEKGLTTKVSRGENGGRTLKHDNVVRVFETFLLQKGPKGLAELVLLDNLVKENAMIVAFVQKKGQKEIERAKAIPLI